MEQYSLTMRGISKSYSGVAAVQGVDFSVRPGEVHALIGENGAGKSTLLNILSGVRAADSGEILVEGQVIQMKNPLSARHAGIAMIHQELQHVPELSVAQNMFLGRPLTKLKGLFVDRKAQYKRAVAILRRLDPSIDPDEPIKNLKVSQQQIVEIARALLDEAKIIAMDEPTSSLTPTEFERLAELISDLKSMNVSLIYVSHKMNEIFKVCDRATILRDGKQVGVVNICDETEETIVTKMVGRKIEKMHHHSYATGREVLRVEGLSRDNAVRSATFSVGAGEVLGIAGLVGSGRTELLKLIAGIDAKTGGSIEVEGVAVKNHNVSSAIRAGIGLVPEDRKKEGIIKERAVKMNMALPSMGRFTRYGLLKRNQLDKTALDVMTDLRLRPLNIEKPIGTLSGGNQQKVIIGRWVAADNKVFLFDEPTRGIDIGAKSEIYNLIEKLAQQGKAIVVVSSEMPEIIRISDRVLVMREGKITKELNGDEITEENIARYAINDVN
ncbi:MULTISPECIES: sugar ABC transporter ATP-binding protein [Rahnella]|jgi:ribose transport system ATP-binding protein|uniref:ABC transporter related protein n=1 Tax=Rahnella sp. (strain Y9602) TaxID=2703885 RepID=A0A0H3F5Y8_RAHSY|nr:MULTISPECIES: sugar ABC transporter ATP-binding protein [Rahnella]ADW72611.1 ABC transporter related protein [Rahnella aceris]MBU9840149.1 sugar ABC transporter ATP-binding protein [Rahnella aceris]MCM2443623.1 sugar ABC transporter ATP-binding protein [Rahnella sp. CG8]MQB52000.1 sugar ABC transporter ATP-binding protein [Rahnella sp. RcJ3]NIA86719.1 sugar ABC transporter ATP-binding protein [Rahnella aceris]